jgi:hypothetical protein
MKNNTKIAIGLGVAALVGFTIWRNYGVKPKDVVILNSYTGNSSTETTNEQKELIQKIDKERTATNIETSFGKYKFIATDKDNGYWTKYAEIWE